MPISEEDLLKILIKQPNMKHLWKEVKKFDIDSNGFLTLSELNSIFFQSYPDLEGKSLFKVFRPFSSIQNKSLVDYKRLKEYLTNRIAAYVSPNALEKTQTMIKQQNQNEEEIENTGNSENLKHKIDVSPRAHRSPSMKRMEQIKDEILKAAQTSPLLHTNGSLAHKYDTIQAPEINIERKTALEALVSPRTNKQILPKIGSSNFHKNMLRKTSERMFSPERMSIGTKFSQYSTFSTPFFSKANDAIKQKLEYEWKNIYRSLNAIDLNSSGLVTKKEFANCVNKNGVFLTNDELAKLLKKFSQNGDVNYVRISNELGLHRTSYNYMKSNSKYLKTASILKSMHKGLNDNSSQYGEMLKAAKTDRNEHRETTKDAIKFALENRKSAIKTLFSGLDKNKTGKVGKENFLKILRTCGVFLNAQEADRFKDQIDNKVNYNSFLQAYTA